MLQLSDYISHAALLEGLAEEASELAHAALKLARILRHENPSAVSLDAAKRHLNEEVADVRLYVDQIDDVDEDLIHDIKLQKLARWVARVLSKGQVESE